MVRSHFPGKPRGRHRKRMCLSPHCDSMNEASLVAVNVYRGLTDFNSTFGLDNEQIPSFHGFSPHQVALAKKTVEVCRKEVEKEFKTRGVIYVPFSSSKKHEQYCQTTNLESRTEVDQEKCLLDEKENAEKLNCDDDSWSSLMSNSATRAFNWNCKSRKKILEENPACLENIDVKTCHDSDSCSSRCKLSLPNPKKFVLPCRSTHSSRVIKPNKRFLDTETHSGETSTLPPFTCAIPNNSVSQSSNFVPLKKPKLIFNENRKGDLCWKPNIFNSHHNSTNNSSTSTQNASKPPRKGILREAILNIDISPIKNNGFKSLSKGNSWCRVQEKNHDPLETQIDSCQDMRVFDLQSSSDSQKNGSSCSKESNETDNKVTMNNAEESRDKPLTIQPSLARTLQDLGKQQLEVVDSHVISVDFWENYDPEEVCKSGFALIGSESIPVQALCFLCGSAGVDQLIHCVSCCEAYHQYCVEMNVLPTKLPSDHNWWRIDWVCPKCTFCATCNDSAPQLCCQHCQKSYHLNCVSPNHQRRQSTDRKWVCPSCLRCKSCNQTNVSKFIGNLPLCSVCFKLRQKGNFCPLCQRCYEDDDYDSKMMECAKCKCWVHAKCEGLSHEKYQVLSYLPESVEYICRVCCDIPPAPWWLAVEEELKTGYLNVLQHLSKNKKACEILKWSPKKRKADCVCQKNGRIRIPRFPESLTSGLKSMYNGDSKCEGKSFLCDSEQNGWVVNRADSEADEYKTNNNVSNFKNLSLPIVKNGESQIGKQKRLLWDETVERNSDNESLDKKPEIGSNTIKDSNIEDEFLEKVECFCSGLETWTKAAPSILSIKKKVNGNEYSSLLEFHEDVQKELDNIIESEDLKKVYNQALIEVFPWFDLEGFKLSDSPSKHDLTKDNSLVLKASDSIHNKREGANDVIESLLSCRKDDYYLGTKETDGRICILCKGLSEGPLFEEGRLLYCGFNDWIHSNCALWSSEVYEEIDGSLQNVHCAISRGKMIRCSKCSKKGATIGCCSKNCVQTFHFPCAKKANCTFFENKTICCHYHSCKSFEGQVIKTEEEFHISRPMYVELDRRKKKLMDCRNVKLMVGSLHIHYLGVFSPLVSDTATAILPIEFQCSRLFWSSVEPWKLVPYYFKTNLVDPTEEYEDVPDLNYTVDHSIVVESSEDMNLAACEVLSSLCDYISLEEEEEEAEETEEKEEGGEGIDMPTNINDLLSEQETVFEDLPNEFFDGVFQDISFKSMSIEDLAVAGVKEDSNESKVDCLSCVEKNNLSSKGSFFNTVLSDKPSASLQADSVSDLTFQTGFSCNITPCQDSEQIGNDDAILHIKIQENCNVMSNIPCMLSSLKDTNLNSFQLLQVDGINDDDSSCSDLCSSSSESEFSASEDNQFSMSSLIQDAYSVESDPESKIPQLDGTFQTTDDYECAENPVECSRCHRTYRTVTSYKRHLASCSSEYMSSSGESDDESIDDNVSSSLSSETTCPNLDKMSLVSEEKEECVRPQTTLNTFCSSNEVITIDELASDCTREASSYAPTPNTNLKSMNVAPSSIEVDPNQISRETPHQSQLMNELTAATSASLLSSMPISNKQLSRSYGQNSAINGKGRPATADEFYSLGNGSLLPSVSNENSVYTGFSDHVNPVNGKGRPVVINGFNPLTSVNELSAPPVESHLRSVPVNAHVNSINGKGRPLKTYVNKKQSPVIPSQPVQLNDLLSQQLMDQQKLNKTIVPPPMFVMQQVPLTPINTSPFLQPIHSTPTVQYVVNLESSNFSHFAPAPAPNPINPSVYQVHQSHLISSIVPQVFGTIAQLPSEQMVILNPQSSNAEFYPAQNVFHSNYVNSQPAVMCLNAAVNNSLAGDSAVLISPMNHSTTSNSYLNKAAVVNCPVPNNSVLSNLSVDRSCDAVSFSSQSIQETAIPVSTLESMNYVIVNASSLNESHPKSLPVQQSADLLPMTVQSAAASNWSINKRSCKTTKEVTTTYYANAELLSHDGKRPNQFNCVKIVQKEMTKETTIKTAAPPLNNTLSNEVALKADANSCQLISRDPNLSTSVKNTPNLSDVDCFLTSMLNANHSNLVCSNEKLESSERNPLIAASYSTCNMKAPPSSSSKSGSNLPHHLKEQIRLKSSSSVPKPTTESIANLDENIDHFKSPDSPPYSLTDVFSSDLKYLRCYPSKKSLLSSNTKTPLTSKTDNLPSKIITSTCKIALTGKKIACDDTADSRILKPANKIENVKPNSTFKSSKNENCSKTKPPIKNIKKCNKPKVMFEINSEDGFSYSTTNLADAWQKIYEAVQQARLARKLPPLPQNPFKNAEASLRSLGLDNNGLKYLLEQLPGVGQCSKYKPSYHKPKSSLIRKEDLLKVNKSGCARSEPFITGNGKYDMFSWLASRHRRPPKLLVATEADLVNGNRRATSLNLPMAMRYRHLKETSKEAVGVFRSDIHGRGLFCLRDIDAGEMVIEYAGEVIRPSLTDKREHFYDSKGIGCYMFRIDDYNVVDATLKGNAARFINHSCEPNCYSRIVDILGKKHILIFAQRRILQGEELTYDYKFPLEEDKISCHCLSRKCRKYLN